jgi:hypothetical protein
LPLDSINTFERNLVRSLAAYGCSVSLLPLEEFNVGDFDLIHIHWPEHLLTKSLSSYPDLLSKIREISLTVPIVFTVHNIKPHAWSNFDGLSFYEKCFSLASGFIHLAPPSIQILKDKFSSIPASLHCVIPHGPYPYLAKNSFEPPDISCQASKYLRCQVTIFGTIRTSEELVIIWLCKLATYALGMNFVSVCRGRITHPTIANPLNLFLRIFSVTLNRFSFLFGVLRHSSLDSEGLEDLISTSNILFIPRVDSLNSGLVYFGLSRNQLVVGPDIGNIGHTLDEYGGCSFSIHGSFFSRLISIFKALRLSRGLLRKPRSGISELASWDSIASCHIEFYEKVKSQFNQCTN